MQADSILLVDDEPHIIELAKLYLEQDGFHTTSVTDGAAALRCILNDQPALVVLDVMLPDLDGFEVCRRVRAQLDVPIILLTGRTDEIEKIVGLELGADDYLTKPFNPRELVARVKAILRRTAPRAVPVSAAPLVIENLRIYPDKCLTTVDGRPIVLRPKAFRLLLALAENPGSALSREKLLEVVWGFDFAGETRTVDVHIAHLRRRLAGMRATIETVWGVGYKLIIEAEA